MPAFQSRLTASTQRMISRYGRTLDYLTVAEGSYDVETSKMTPEVLTEYQIKGYKTKTSYSESQNPNLIGKDTAVYLIAGAGLTFTPEVGDRIQDALEDSDYQIQMISKIDVQDTVGLYRVICTRS